MNFARTFFLNQTRNNFVLRYELLQKKKTERRKRKLCSNFVMHRHVVCPGFLIKFYFDPWRHKMFLWFFPKLQPINPSSNPNFHFNLPPIPTFFQNFQLSHLMNVWVKTFQRNDPSPRQQFFRPFGPSGVSNQRNKSPHTAESTTVQHTNPSEMKSLPTSFEWLKCHESIHPSIL